jgi:hypothetical protein
MSEDRHYELVSIPSAMLRIALGGTILGGIALMVVFDAARLLILGPVFGLELPSGRELALIPFSMAFICSIGYGLYFAKEELVRRDYCERRGLTPRKK